MSLPKNKRRQILVENQLYYWHCTQQLHCEYPKGYEGERPDANGILPALDSRVEWMGYEDVYGYSLIYSIFIENAQSTKKAIVKIDGNDYLPNVLDPKSVQHIPITPAMLKTCIDFLSTKNMWESSFQIIKECDFSVLETPIRNALQKR